MDEELFSDPELEEIDESFKIIDKEINDICENLALVILKKLEIIFERKRNERT